MSDTSTNGRSTAPLPESVELAMKHAEEQHALNEHLPGAVARRVESIHELPTIRRLDRGVLPSRENASAVIERLMQLVFPGYFGRQGLTHEALPFRVGEIVMELSDQLYDQIRFCLRYR